MTPFEKRMECNQKSFKIMDRYGQERGALKRLGKDIQYGKILKEETMMRKRGEKTENRSIITDQKKMMTYIEKKGNEKNIRGEKKKISEESVSVIPCRS